VNDKGRGDSGSCVEFGRMLKRSSRGDLKKQITLEEKKERKESAKPSSVPKKRRAVSCSPVTSQKNGGERWKKENWIASLIEFQYAAGERGKLAAIWEEKK